MITEYADGTITKDGRKMTQNEYYRYQIEKKLQEINDPYMLNLVYRTVMNITK